QLRRPGATANAPPSLTGLSLWRARALHEIEGPDADAVALCWRQAGHFEEGAIERGHGARNPRELLADDGAGRVEPLGEDLHVRRRGAVVVVDVAVDLVA